MSFKNNVALGFLLTIGLVLGCNQNSGPAKAKEKQAISALEFTLKAAKDVKKDADSAKELVAKSQSFAEKYPNDALSAEYLFKAADVARGLGNYKEAVEIWLKVYTDYAATYAKAADALFLTAFTYDKDLQDKGKAKEYYSLFLDKYPKHPYTKDVKLMMGHNQNNKSDVDLIKEFKKKNEDAPLE